MLPFEKSANKCDCTREWAQQQVPKTMMMTGPNCGCSVSGNSSEVHSIVKGIDRSARRLSQACVSHSYASAFFYKKSSRCEKETKLFVSACDLPLDDRNQAGNDGQFDESLKEQKPYQSDRSSEGNHGEESSLVCIRDASSSLQSSFISSTFYKPIPRPDEPNLYNIPDGLHCTYQPMSVLTKVALALASTLVATLWTDTETRKALRLQPSTIFKFASMPWHITSARWVSFLLHTSTTHGASGAFQIIREAFPWKRICWLVFRSLFVLTLSSIIWQDLFLYPSRISTQTLIKNYTLPSKLSRFGPVPFIDHENPNKTTLCPPITTYLPFMGSSPVHVHWIEYHKNSNTEHKSNSTKHQSSASLAPLTRTEETVDCIYCNHGFGASCLSWLPILPNLTHLAHGKVGLSHDSVGFGFTDRPSNHLSYYCLQSSAKIAVGLLLQAHHETTTKQPLLLRELDEVNTYNVWDKIDVNKTNPVDLLPLSVVLFGHSMGALTTLRMALLLYNTYHTRYASVGCSQPTLKIRIILTAPALGFSLTRSKQRKLHKKPSVAHGARRPVQSMLSFDAKSKRLAVVGSVGNRVSRYGLRRLVGTRRFWRNGLRSVWGDPSRLSESDVLRFQWPSIGQGWEQGILNFAKAQLKQSSSYSMFNDVDMKNDIDGTCFSSDEELFHAVLDLQNKCGVLVSVDVILGGKDKVVPVQKIQRFLSSKSFSGINIPVHVLDDCGHDPFEENIPLFLSTVQKILTQRE